MNAIEMEVARDSSEFHPKRSGLAEVARVAGVSLRTVTRALHNPQIVSESTRRRIEEAQKAIGYVPDLLARSLVSRRSGVITALIPPIADPVFIETIRALSETVGAQGYQLLVGHMGYQEQTEAEVIAAFLGRRPDAMVLTGVTHSEAARQMLRRADIPVVELWNLTDSPIDMVVGFSNFEAARALTHRIWAMGRRRIALVTRPVAYSDRARDRRLGYEEAMRELGVRLEPGSVLEVAGDLQDGARAVRLLRSRRKRPDAIILTGENLAAGAALELLAAGVRVPDEVLIAGFGNLNALTSVPLDVLSVRIDGAEIGRRAGALISDRLSKAGPAGAALVDVGFRIA